MPAAPHRPMNAAEWGLLILLSLLWGGSFFFTGIAVAALPPLTIVALRVGLAALILNLALRPMGLSLPADRRVWAAFVGMGILNNVVPFSLIVFGQTRIGSGLAAILNATTPLFAVAVAHLATPDERLTPARLAGVAGGLLGVVAMVGPAALHGLGGELAAQLACLAAALSYAVAGLYGRRFQALGVAPPATAAGMLTASAVLIAPLALLVDRPWTLPWPGPAAVAALLGLAALSTALAYLLYFRLLASAGATNLLLVTFLIPVSAVALGVLVLGETIAARQILGMALIGAGLAAIDGRALRLLAPHRRPNRAPGSPNA
jgi:drug/metabolite transporter (DMT)-like permease